MATVETRAPAAPPADDRGGVVRPLRREEYEHLVAAGHFAGERIELLQGYLVEMRPQDPRHAATIRRLQRALSSRIGARGQVDVQLPLAAGADAEPEPDLAVVAPGDYKDAHPTTALLAIEVAGSSLAQDRGLKAQIYARAGIPEYWIVNLEAGLIEVHTEIVAGAYTRVTPYRAGESIRLAAFPDVAIVVAEILG